MSTAKDGWYVAEPDGTTSGPMTRDELTTAQARGAWSAAALAWHVDLAEWRPLTRIGVSGSSTAPPDQRAPNPEREARAQARDAKAARLEDARRADDDGRRLLSHAANAPASAAATPKPKPKPKPMPAATPTPATGAPTAVTSEAQGRAAQGGRRFVARLVDTLTVGVLAATVFWGIAQAALIDSGRGYEELPVEALLAWLAVFALVPVETLMLATVGTTPGKALLGLRVVRLDGRKPGLAAAFARTTDLLWRGLGLGLPMITLITSVVGFSTLVNQGRATWDIRNGLRVEATPIEGARWQTAVAIVIAALILLTSGVLPDLAREIAALR